LVSTNSPWHRQISYKDKTMSAPSRSGYSGIQILLHWTIALLVIFQLGFGESMTTIVDAREGGEAVQPLDQTLATGHLWAGIAILALVVVRLLVRLAQGTPEPGGSGITIHLAKLAHAAFYLLLVAMPVTGLLTYYDIADLGDVHGWGKPVFIGLIALHALAALYHQFLVKDGTLARMLTPRRG
jgi:cytochrome b561